MKPVTRMHLLVASIATVEPAHAQEAAAYATFFWGAIGGATLLLVGLVVWFILVLLRSRKSQSADQANIGQVASAPTQRLGE